MFCCCIWTKCCCCRKKGDAAAAPAKANGKKGADPAVDRILAKFQAAFDQTFAVEDSIRTFLQTDIFTAYEPVFISAAVTQRVFSSQGKDAQGKPVKKKPGQVQVTQMPTEPTESKDTKKGQLLWDKYVDDKKSYETWALGKARRTDLSVGAQITYPDDLLYLQPISDKTGKPYKVFILKLPGDTSKATWSDELKAVTAPLIDPNARKHKTVLPKLKGLSDRCFKASKDDIIAKLMVLTRSDAAVWEGCAPKKVAKKGEPKEPKAPPDLVDPAVMFQEGKNAGKYGDFDEEGIPKTKGEKELKDGEVKVLKKQWDKAKTVWDKHQAAMQTYQEEMKKLYPDLESGEDDFGVPDDRRLISCNAAALALVVKLVEDQLVRRSEELAGEVNKGLHDTPALQEVVVQETLEDVETITDPVLKAFRRFDEQATNSCRADVLKDLFRALGDDELQLGTHAFYNEVSDKELDMTRSKLSEVGLEIDGTMDFENLKIFLEAADLSDLPGEMPKNLASCLAVNKIEQRISNLTKVEVIWSPRTWRTKLTEEFGSPGSPKGIKSPKGPGSARKSLKKSGTKPVAEKGAASPKQLKAMGSEDMEGSQPLSPKEGSPKEKRKSTSDKKSPKAKEEKDDKKEKKDRKSVKKDKA